MEVRKNFVGGDLVVATGVARSGADLGDLHAAGCDGVEFYTEKKVVISRW
jgi:hypothetical protein